MIIPLFIAVLAVLGEAALSPLGDELQWLGRIAIISGIVIGSMRNR